MWRILAYRGEFVLILNNLQLLVSFKYLCISIFILKMFCFNNLEFTFVNIILLQWI